MSRSVTLIQYSNLSFVLSINTKEPDFGGFVSVSLCVNTFAYSLCFFCQIINDPSGNSFIQNPFAPQKDRALSVSCYNRTPEQNTALGIQVRIREAGITDKSRFYFVLAFGNKARFSIINNCHMLNTLLNSYSSCSLCSHY